MCKYLEPATFMANVLSVRQEQASIDFVSFRIIRDHVTERLADQNVIIEWTRDAVMDAMYSYNNIFQEVGGKVSFRDPLPPANPERIFNFGLTNDFLRDFHEAIGEVQLQPS